MRISKRALAVQKAQTNLETVIYDTADAAGLTPIELLQALASCQQEVLKDLLRAERHSDDLDRAADVE